MTDDGQNYYNFLMVMTRLTVRCSYERLRDDTGALDNDIVCGGTQRGAHSHLEPIKRQQTGIIVNRQYCPAVNGHVADRHAQQWAVHKSTIVTSTAVDV